MCRMPMNRKPVKIEDGVKKQLERLKNGEFKRKYRTKSISDVIGRLLEIKNKYDVLREEQKGIVETGKIEEPPIREEGEEDDYFPCNLLCRKSRSCNSTSRNIKSEIVETGCYVSIYPYEWTAPDGRLVRVCKFMFFSNNFPHDAEEPYPKCLAKQKDVPIQLAKDHIMRNPQVCWICYKMRKKARATKEEARIFGRATRSKVNWGASEGNPDLWSLGNT